MTVTLLAIACLLPAQASATLGQGLNGHWRFDESAGPTAADASGNGLNGTWAQGVSAALPANSTIPYANPWCAQFDGSSGSISVADNAKLRFTGDMSVALWVNPANNPSDWQRLVGKGSMYGGRNFGVWREGSGRHVLWQSLTSGNNIVFNVTSSGTLPENTWTHVCCTVSGMTASIYINGTFNMSGPLSGTPVVSADPVTFGRAIDAVGATFHLPFQGRLDEARIYNRALSAAEILALSQGQGGAAPPGAPTNVKVYDAATSTLLAAGGTLTQPAATLQATVTASGGASAGLQVEVQLVGTPFTNAPNRPAGALVASGQAASVLVDTLTFLANYHAQVRAVDSAGLLSAWVSVGTNPDNVNEKDFGAPSSGPPPACTGIQQVNPISGLPLRIGGSLVEKRIRIQAFLTDAGSKPVRLNIEMAESGSSFKGVATATSASVPSGELAWVDLDVTAGAKSFQVSATNVWGVSSAWTPLGGNPDITIVGVGSEGETLSDVLTTPSCAGSAGAGGGTLACALLALSALARRAARGSCA